MINSDDKKKSRTCLIWNFLLFDEVLALFSGQEDFGTIGQSVDKRRLLTTVPQLNGLHTDLKEHKHSCGQN